MLFNDDLVCRRGSDIGLNGVVVVDEGGIFC